MDSKISFQKKALSACGGLILFDQAIKRLELAELLADALPQPKIACRSQPFDKFKALLLGLIAGADALDDMDRLRYVPIFQQLNEGLVAATTYGDFLRQFSGEKLQKLNQKLSELSGRLRSLVYPDDRLIFDIDSTSHVQHGEKMEGLGFNYKSEWGLDSIEVFDERGFLYYINVREGGTFTADDAPFIIGEVVRHLPAAVKKQRPLLRADSGYCNNLVFEACEHQNLDFVIGMRENLYAPLLKRRLHWRRAQTKEFSCEGAEFAESLYLSKRCNKVFRVVFLRWPTDVKVNQPAGFVDSKWRYQAFITSVSSGLMNGEEVARLYRQRGHAENYIRELKNGFDLHHFPCLKLNANRCYGIIAAFAYNLMRVISWLTEPSRPPFAKRLRFLLVNLACQVVHKARQTVFIFDRRHEQEVKRCLMNIQLSLGYG